MSYPGIQISSWGGQLVFCSKYFSALLTQGRHWEHRDCIKWRRRQKFLRVRCKNLAFYTTEPLNEPFFAEQKMKNGAAGKKNSRNIHFSKALPWFNHGSTRRGKNAGKKIESALIWGRHLQKGLVKSVGFFFPSRFLCFFFFFENQFLEKLVFKTSFFNHPNTLFICACREYEEMNIARFTHTNVVKK